uniref:CCT domain-containing protein n=1 Tax=Spongospora subterranea TaxID=70186 RepID=A0A0H5QPW0_9EUKA|eukprot:CRZ04130.1 hypothetical protein [Spongospora subterranea]
MTGLFNLFGQPQLPELSIDDNLDSLISPPQPPAPDFLLDVPDLDCFAVFGSDWPQTPVANNDDDPVPVVNDHDRPESIRALRDVDRFTQQVTETRPASLRQPSAHVRLDYNWEYIPDPLYKDRIVKWKLKKKEIVNGQSTPKKYPKRQNYAKQRARSNGRFVPTQGFVPTQDPPDQGDTIEPVTQ